MTLTKNLLDVLQANANHTLSSNYQQIITANSAVLDNLHVESTAESSPRASLVCKAAVTLFGNKTITPESSNYTAEVEKDWSSDCWLPSACILKPQNSLEVALALRIITTLQATFAVRGAGHNSNPGFSGVGQQGVLIDLGALNQITLNEDNSIVSIEPGSTWDAVYGVLEEFNLTAAGGRAAGVGVAGLLLGGGMTHFSNFWGMACDNVLNYEIVLADSTTLQVNANENADLFKALKGGGSNFGIVTRFDVRTFPGSELWFQFVVYNASDKEAVMVAAVEVEEAMLSDNRIGFFLSDTAAAFTAGMVYRGGPPSPDVFKAFDAINPLMVAVPPTNGTFQSCAIIAALPKGQVWQIGGLSVATDAELYVQLHDILVGLPNNDSLSFSYTYQPFSAQGVAYGASNGGNILNISPQNQAWLAFAISWADSNLTESGVSQVSKFMSQMASAAKAKEELLNFVFMNDANSLQDPIASYGLESVAYLKSISTKYDDQGVFQKLQNDGFLVSKV